MTIPRNLRLSRPFHWYATWSCENGGTDFSARGRRYLRRVRLGWLTFEFGEFYDRPPGTAAYDEMEQSIAIQLTLPTQVVLRASA